MDAGRRERITDHALTADLELARVLGRAGMVCMAAALVGVATHVAEEILLRRRVKHLEAELRNAQTPEKEELR